MMDVPSSAVEAMAKAHCDFFGGEGWWETGLIADTKPKALDAMRVALEVLPAPEPVAWVAPLQLAAIVDRPQDTGGEYIPVRKSVAGRFTMPLYSSSPTVVEGESGERGAIIAWLQAEIEAHNNSYRLAVGRKDQSAMDRCAARARALTYATNAIEHGEHLYPEPREAGEAGGGS
jgi:hypothetical protein